jgi:hypothetical protein
MIINVTLVSEFVAANVGAAKLVNIRGNFYFLADDFIKIAISDNFWTAMRAAMSSVAEV